MLVLPLGLGTKLRRLPLVTLAVCLAWTAAFVVDRSEPRISQGVLDAVATSGVRDATRTLFMQYCHSHRGDRARCRRYAVLVWTGFPAKVHRTVARSRRAHADLDLQTAVAEQRAADAIRKELGDCEHSTRCFHYKDIVWSFMDHERQAPASFAGFTGYEAYSQAVRLYRLNLRRLCIANACLVRDNINLPSLAAAQMRHGGVMHLVGNMLALLIFGMYVEQRTNRLLYLATLVVGGTIGMAVHTAFFGTADSIALGGSANVSAVMGMFYVFFFRTRMRFGVWLPIFDNAAKTWRERWGWRTFSADVKYCFPLLFVVTDVAGGMDNGFAKLLTPNVAHFAHLTGLTVGIAVGLVIMALRRLPSPLIYETELDDMRAIEASRDLGEVFTKAARMIEVNPDNVHALEAACGAYLRWSHVAKPGESAGLAAQGRAFLLEHLATVCAINTRKGQTRYACKLLSQVPLSMPYQLFLGRLGQISLLRLGDFAVSQGHPLLALRLYDCFLVRFPLSREGAGVEDTLADILRALPPSRDNAVALQLYLENHPQSLMAPRLAAWLQNADGLRRAPA